MSINFLKKPENEIELLMSDIIRVLGLLLGRLWLSELSSEVLAFRESVGRPLEFSDRDLQLAIRRLKDLNIVNIEEGLRATFGKPEPDILVGLNVAVPIIEFLSKDDDIKKYKMLLRGS
ncbi:MAG: hypothetical protein QXE05_01990 [Nitrososphaeria archaeon]